MDQITSFSSLFRRKGLKLIHLNVSSLLKKIDQLRVIFSTPEVEIITISETWLQTAHPTDSLDINGYACFRQDRSQKLTKKTRGGGLLTYVKNNMADNCMSLRKLDICDTFLEAQWLRIERDNVNNIIVCNLYRPPEGNLTEAIDYLNKCLQSINTTKNDIFIMGDLNVNYKNTLSPNYKKLIFFEHSNNLKQVIKETTRNTDKSKTLIDLILTNAKHIDASGTLDSFISDHQPIFVIKKKQRNSNASVEFEGRPYKKLDLDKLLNNLHTKKWADFYAIEDPEEAWSFLQTKINDELNLQCPVRKFKIKKYIPEWICPELADLIRDRNYFYKKAKLTNNKDDWNIAKHLRNVANSGIRKAKATFVQNKLEEHAKDSSKFWRELKSIYPSSKTKSDRGKICLVDATTNKQIPEAETAGYINNYFINVGNFASNCKTNTQSKTSNKPKKSKKTNKRGRQISTSTIIETQAQWSIPIFSEDDVSQLVCDINVNKSSGLLHINNKILKSILKVLLAQLTHIFNLSVETSIVPDSWKDALVIPIPKKGDLSSVTNYRPISLLPQPGKIMEKLVHDRLTHYIESNDLLSKKQHGFRKTKSTLDALFQLTSQINLNMDRRCPTLVTFIDFKKAFDCVQHDLLIQKVKKLNLDGSTIKWLVNYLTHRQQKVLANNQYSDPMTVTQGVPQGSIIGPLLYIIYADDITKLIKNCHVTLYADDTVFYSNGKSLNAAMKDMQKSLMALELWCNRNGIFMNVSKTKFMIFGSKVSLAKVRQEEVKLFINKQPIARVHNYCYLGLTLDEQLNFEMHAQNTIRKVKNKLIQLRSMRYFLNQKAALLVYKNMILPILEYGDIFANSLSKATRGKLQTMQNKALRLALNKRDRGESEALHKETRLQKLNLRRKVHVLQFVFKRKHVNSLLTRAPTGRITRSAKKINFLLRKPNTEKYKTSISYSGFKLWNQLPLPLQNIDDPNCFKHRIKSLLYLKKEA